MSLGRSAEGRLFGWLAAQILALWGAGTFFVLHWGYALPAAALHAWALLAWHAGALVAALLVRRSRPALAALILLSWVGPLLLLGLQALAHAFWAGPMTLDVVLLYAASIGAVGEHLGIPMGVLLLVGLAVLGALGAGAWRVAAWLPRPLAALAVRKSRLLGLVALAFSYAFILPLLSDLPYRHPLRGEPMALLSQASVFAPGPAQAQALQRDQVERERMRQTAPARHPTVVLILVDALRADRLGLGGYGRDTSPFLDRLAADRRSWRPARALAAAPESALSILGLLGSREAGWVSRGLFKLNEVLADQGWAVRFVLSGDHGWMGLREALGQADSIQDGRQGPFSVSNDDHDLLTALDDLDWDDPRPLFLHLHLMSTHALGVKDPRFQRWNPSLLNRLAWRDYYDAEPFSNRYDNGVLQADAIIAAIHARLQAAGRLDDALFIVTGDHGEALGERGRFGHSFTLDPEVMEVPMLIWDSRGRCCAPQAWASHLDLAPTVLRALGLPQPATWQGRALQDPAPSERWLHSRSISRRPARALYRLTPSQAHKLVLAPQQQQGGDLYDLTADPDERSPLSAGSQAALRQRMELEMQVREALGRP